MPQSLKNHENLNSSRVLALQVLDLADKEGWHYAPLSDGCRDRGKLEAVINENDNATFDLVINYLPDCADSVNVSFENGKIVLELEDNFYYDFKTVDSVDKIKEVVLKMLEKYNA